MPEITVVIPCYNYGCYLDEAVDSVLEQSCQDFEIVVVDDGSTDADTRALLASYERPKTTLLRTPNRGPAAARNTGIRSSTGRYVVNLDADDWLHPQFLEKTKAVLDGDDRQRLGFVTTWMRKFGDEEHIIKPASYSPMSLALTNDIHGSSLFRREAWEKSGGYRESFIGWEDWNLWLNMVGSGYRWEVVPEELAYYRRHGETRSHRSLERRIEIFEAIIKDSADFYRKNYRQLLKICYAKLVELESVWREKDVALDDNRTLLDHLAAEKKAHQMALEEYRRLETYCRHLEATLEDKSQGEQRTEQECRRLEAYCRSLESALRESGSRSSGTSSD